MEVQTNTQKCSVQSWLIASNIGSRIAPNVTKTSKIAAALVEDNPSTIISIVCGMFDWGHSDNAP